MVKEKRIAFGENNQYVFLKIRKFDKCVEGDILVFADDDPIAFHDKNFKVENRVYISDMIPEMLTIKLVC